MWAESDHESWREEQKCTETQSRLGISRPNLRNKKTKKSRNVNGRQRQSDEWDKTSSLVDLGNSRDLMLYCVPMSANIYKAAYLECLWEWDEAPADFWNPVQSCCAWMTLQSFLFHFLWRPEMGVTLLRRVPAVTSKCREKQRVGSLREQWQPGGTAGLFLGFYVLFKCQIFRGRVVQTDRQMENIIKKKHTEEEGKPESGSVRMRPPIKPRRGIC